MSTAEERIAVFQDTMDWIEKDPDLSSSVAKAKKNTTVFYEDDYPSFDISGERSMTITVSGERSYQAAMRLRRQRPFAKIAVMNFANAFHAGGGVTKGSSAQEESLCRTSTLYPLLYRRTLRDTFYKHHHELNTPKASDSLIYTEGVVICKTDEDHPKRMPRKDWVTVDVITIAAPDLRRKSNQHAPLVHGGTYMNDAELFGYHVKRAIHMFTCAAAKGAEILVLGAFGCGAFENDPEVVARAYKTALQEFPNVFDIVVFAVYCPPGGSRNHEVFDRVFALSKYDPFLRLIPELARGDFGEIIYDTKNDGSPEHPIQLPYVNYSDTVDLFIRAIYDFDACYPEYDLHNYSEVLERYGVPRDAGYEDIDVSDMELHPLMALFMYAVRAERFCDGTLLDLCKKGLLMRWLKRLEEIAGE